MVIFATAHGVGALLVARVVQGLATGAAAGAVGAGMLDLDRAQGHDRQRGRPDARHRHRRLAVGPDGRSTCRRRRTLVYLVLAAIFVAQAIGVARMPETASPPAGRARVAAAAASRCRPGRAGAMLLAAPGAGRALGAGRASTARSARRCCAGSSVRASLALGGLALFVLAASGARHRAADRARARRAR